MRYHPHLASRHVAKSHAAIPPGFKVFMGNTLHYKPIFDPTFEKSCKGSPVPDGGCASKTRSFSSACKNLEAQHPLGPEYGLPKNLI